MFMANAEKKKSFNINFIPVGDRSADVLRNLAKREIEKVLAKHGAVSHNLDEVLHKYITVQSEEMRNDRKEG